MNDARNMISTAFLALLLAVAGCTSAPQSAPTPNAPTKKEAAAGQTSFVGSRAPDFLLPDQDKKMVGLGDYRGQWVVLYFYPADDTPGCTCQASAFTALLQHLHELDVVVLGVSPDGPESHAMNRKKYDLRIRLLSDETRSTMRQYGAWAEQSIGAQVSGRAVRSSVLISPDGRIAYHWPAIIAKGHAELVRDKLAELKATAPAPATGRR